MQHCIILTQTKLSDAAFAAICSNLDKCRLGADGDVILCTFWGMVVLDKCVKFHDPSLNCSREISPEAVGDGIFDCFAPNNFRPEVDNDAVSGMAVDNVGMDVCVKYGDYKSNGFRDIRGADFVSNERARRSLSQWRETPFA